MSDVFRRFAHWASNVAGTAWAFLAAVALIVGWAATGPLFQFSDTWQLVINTTTTVVTFLMVFLIQNTQNRDSKALHAKLDELIIVTQAAHDEVALAEDMSDDELAELHRRFVEVAHAEAAKGPGGESGR